MPTAIKIENVSKQYRLGVISTGTLSHDLNRWWTTSVLRREDPYLKIGETNDRASKGNSEYVWALKDINMEIERGDVVGIIGKNGAGKSTLLKLLSRVTKPTTGTIKYKGRIASLLEVGTGFHPEMTGRENIYMNGAIMGMTRAEITRKLDEIVDFSGCERYIDTPVKRYSSGMTVRLGFAIAAHLDPEILVVDEVLAVGDAEFQKKAIGKMQDVSKGEGRTVLFVSHNMGSIRQLCKNAIVLDIGQIVMSDNVDAAVDFYLQRSQISKTSTQVVITDEFRDKGHVGDVKFVSFRLVKDNALFSTTEPIVFQILLHADKSRQDCHINCTIWNSEGSPVGSVVSFDGFVINKGEDKTIEYTISNPGLAIGLYTFSFSVGSGDATMGLTLFDAVRNFITIEVDRIDDDNYFALWRNTWGNIYLKSSTKEII